MSESASEIKGVFQLSDKRIARMTKLGQKYTTDVSKRGLTEKYHSFWKEVAKVLEDLANLVAF